jgi:hypothetical protein
MSAIGGRSRLGLDVGRFPFLYPQPTSSLIASWVWSRDCKKKARLLCGLSYLLKVKQLACSTSFEGNFSATYFPNVPIDAEAISTRA